MNNLIDDDLCPCCEGTGENKDYTDGKCSLCKRKGYLTESERWNWEDAAMEKYDIEAERQADLYWS